MVSPLKALASSLLTFMMSLWAMVAVVDKLTEGFSSFTSESWRRQAVARQALELPILVLQDEHGRVLTLADGVPSIVDFVYTRCDSVCLSLGASSSRMAADLARQGLTDKVRVVSISLDPLHDQQAQRQAFKARMEASPTPWQVAASQNTQAQRALQKAMGVVAIPDGRGGLDHNAALHLVNGQGALVAILDIDDMASAVTQAAALARAGSP